MSVLTDLIYGGSNAVAGLTENAVNEAIAAHGVIQEHRRSYAPVKKALGL